MAIVTIVKEIGTRVIDVEEGTTLLNALQGNSIDIYAPCGGNGTCNKCRIQLEGHGTVLSCQYRVEADIAVILPASLEMEVLVTQHEHSLVLPFLPDHTATLSSYPLGLAIDLGTTTIAAYQVNLITGVLSGIRTAVNPQVKYGADVISRINYCTEHKNGTKDLQAAVIAQINDFIRDFAEENHVDPEFFTKILVAGNTTMLHLLAGIDPSPLALAPFTPEFTDLKLLFPSQIGLRCHKDAEVSLLPSVSAYVGSDILAGIASLKDEGDEPYLYIDIGTNGEMALVTKKKTWCCSTAAGPAFEGANISCGSGAVPGAVSVFSKDGLKTIGHRKPGSICGSGLIDIVAYLVDSARISSDGILAEDFIVSPSSKNNVPGDIILNQQDIREVQLAKGAISAGISILMKEAGLEYEQISRLYVAGGFGNYMNLDSAMRIGLLPEEMKGKTIPIGNAAGSGARLALLSKTFISRIELQRQKTEYIELSYNADFPLEFAMKMNFF